MNQGPELVEGSRAASRRFQGFECTLKGQNGSGPSAAPQGPNHLVKYIDTENALPGAAAPRMGRANGQHVIRFSYRMCAPQRAAALARAAVGHQANAQHRMMIGMTPVFCILSPSSRNSDPASSFFSRP